MPRVLHLFITIPDTEVYLSILDNILKPKVYKTYGFIICVNNTNSNVIQKAESLRVRKIKKKTTYSIFVSWSLLYCSSQSADGFGKLFTNVDPF